MAQLLGQQLFNDGPTSHVCWVYRRLCRSPLFCRRGQINDIIGIILLLLPIQMHLFFLCTMVGLYSILLRDLCLFLVAIRTVSSRSGSFVITATSILNHPRNEVIMVNIVSGFALWITIMTKPGTFFIIIKVIQSSGMLYQFPLLSMRFKVL